MPQASRPKSWLVIGTTKNWDTALSQPVPIWGLKSRYLSEFQSMIRGDLLWFYATSPVSGVIGVGATKDKYIDDRNPVWEEEQVKKKVIWPLRFRIHVLKILPKPRWKMDCIKITDFNLFWRQGFQLLREEHVRELLSRSKEVFGITNEKGLYIGSTISFPEKELVVTDETIEETQINAHRSLQEQIAEIGKLQFYYAQVEYPIELSSGVKNIDVVWKREIDGAPTFAFEVELSGMLEKAIARLKYAYKRWNSRTRIVVPGDYFKKANDLVASEERDFSRQLKIYKPDEILSLLTAKRELRNLEQSLEIY